ncbi:hypothetical protein MYSTI_00115 [Myxococcus stipitatus DSM 14675]|uniref:Uncharacterized protein n=1 Tax=Myxococcus stipitatus (strain DSM 14675 / JCM 12634 / Mx s8) TaxID=1278073 RepID=L7U4Q4_MYXSD|nr:hypothetical protein MYSTI_00115 [Myxococcus stipitatus DSM 14675]
MAPVSGARPSRFACVAAGADGAYTRGIVSGLSRLLTLALLLGWQVVASGVAGLGHYCERQVQRRSSKCECPHTEAHAADDARSQPAFQSDCCDEPHWDLPAPTEASLSSYSPFLAAPPALPPAAWLHAQAPAYGPQRSLALWDVPHAQGPPVFLRIRTLLI